MLPDSVTVDGERPRKNTLSGADPPAVADFNAVISALTDEIVGSNPDRRTEVMLVLRSQCDRLIYNQMRVHTGFHRQEIQSLNSRHEEKQENSRRVLEVKMREIRELKLSRKLAVTTAILHGTRYQEGVAVHFIFLMWGCAVRCGRKKASALQTASGFRDDGDKTSSKSSRKRHVSQENAPPRNGANHAVPNMNQAPASTQNLVVERNALQPSARSGNPAMMVVPPLSARSELDSWPTIHYPYRQSFSPPCEFRQGPSHSSSTSHLLFEGASTSGPEDTSLGAAPPSSRGGSSMGNAVALPHGHAAWQFQ